MTHRLNKIWIQGILMCMLSGMGYLSKGQGYYFYDNGFFEPGWLWEGALNFGAMNCITDIAGSKSGKQGLGAATLNNTHLTGGISLSTTWKDVVAFRLDYNRGMVEAHDSLLKGATHYSAIGRYERNLNFRSTISEFFIAAELHPVFLRDYQIYDRYMPRMSPYGLVGVGMVNFKPQALVGEEWIDLQPLRLEGQGFDEYPDRKEYSRTVWMPMFGAGFRYELNRLISLRIEGLWRMPRTDYIDDVSQRDWVDPSLFFKYLPPSDAILASQLYNRSTIVNPPRNTRPRGETKDKDVYWSVNLKVGFALNRGRR